MRGARGAALLVALVASGAGAYEPAIDFALACQGCHRADGAATPGSVPALAGSVACFLAVPGGREYLIQVPGVAQAALDDAALARVINWMLGRFDPQHLPPGFVPYTTAEVGRLRTKPLTDVDGVRARLVAAAGERPDSRSSPRAAPPTERRPAPRGAGCP